MKIKISKIDQMFSLFIRTRAHWHCVRCGVKHPPPTSALHTAHFIGRGNKATRFDPKNCVALCYGCHSHFDGAGREEFREFMLGRLGKKEFGALLRRGRSIKKESEAVQEAMKWLGPFMGDKTQHHVSSAD